LLLLLLLQLLLQLWLVPRRVRWLSSACACPSTCRWKFK